MKKLTALLALAIVALFACQTVSPSPTPTPIAASTILEKAALAMEKVTSFHFELTQEGGGTPIMPGIEMKRAEGDVARPDKLKTRIGATLLGTALDLQLVTVGDETFITNPLTRLPERIGSEFKALSIFNPDTGILAVLKAMSGLTRKDDEQLDGRPCYRISGKVAAKALQSFTLSFIEGATVEGELWVDKESLLLRQVRFAGQIAQGDPAGMVRNLKLSRFDEKFDIQLPK